MSSDDDYLGVLKALYDYTPTSDDEIAIKEDQILFLKERVDDDWWKVKLKGDSQDDDLPTGLVPAAYVEPADHNSVVKAMYDYAASAPGELTITEDEVLLVFDTEADWILVQSKKPNGKAGYVPANYVEAYSADDEPVPAPVQIIVPDDPPRPVSTYVDPADRVASSKASADDIKTWSVSEVDKKGKKMKGTLGIGNGAVFFASETSKAAVQKWQTVDITHIAIEKGKHVHFDVAGPNATSLHFSSGSKDTAEAIMAKLESSRAMSLPGGAPGAATESAVEDEELDEAPAQKTRDTRKASVHFQPGSPTIIPPKDTPSDEEETETETEPAEPTATVLYDFTADGPDELSATEGEIVVVLEDDDNDWWKCRNSKRKEGVIPASYLEPASKPIGVASSSKRIVDPEPEEAEDDDTEEREAEGRARAEAAAQAEAEAEAKAKAKAEREAKREAERKKAEAERRAKEAADAADARREQKKKQDEATKRSAASRTKNDDSSPSPRPSVDQGRPAPENVRVWHDRTGQFRVDAAFLGYSNGKLRLHKTNGVIVEVPSEKMSPEDMKYVQKMTSKKNRAANAKTSDDDIPIGVQYPNANGKRISQVPKKKAVDWFEFFLNAGCEIDDCTRYSSSFDREKIDEAVLPDITEGTLRSLGLREGDIIRVMKAIEKKKPKKEESDQLKKDEEMAHQLQAELNGSSKPAPNLFVAGPGGALKAPRRGRPNPSKSLPPGVDMNLISGVTRTDSPSLLSPVQAPPRSSSAVGFDDDAWTNRPSSTKPLTPRAPSAPPSAASQPAAAPEPTPAPAPPSAAAPVTMPPPQSAPATPANGLANTTQNDIFNQLARLSELRKNTSSVPIPAVPTPPAAVSSLSYQSGLGMGSSPVSMGQHLQNQQTGFVSTPPPQQPYNGPRGPFAPVPSNQGLLQPLVPTQTGFNSFIPTRPNNNVSPFANPSPQHSFLNSQPTGFQPQQQLLLPQRTGFPGMQPVMSQPTGFPMQQQQQSQQSGFSMQPQPTGMPFGGMNGGGIMSQPTGMPSNSFGTFNVISSPPPVPPLPSNNTNPANIFAQMKSGTFAKDDAPQAAGKYDALRPNPMQPQATGWGGGGGYGGYGYQQ